MEPRFEEARPYQPGAALIYERVKRESAMTSLQRVSAFLREYESAVGRCEFKSTALRWVLRNASSISATMHTRPNRTRDAPLDCKIASRAHTAR